MLVFLLEDKNISAKQKQKHNWINNKKASQKIVCALNKTYDDILKKWINLGCPQIPGRKIYPVFYLSCSSYFSHDTVEERSNDTGTFSICLVWSSKLLLCLYCYQ